MECNQEDAVKAKELAEKKILEKDLAGAKMLALKAQDLCPNLGGLPQLLATIEVYASSERKIHGEVDWYGVLGVDPTADDETIRTRYRKLALTLHPDKNKSTGANGAFSLISQAWSLLSDKAKKIVYDQKRNSGVVKQTFRIMCNFCRTQFEYSLADLNRKLACIICHRKFVTFEVPTQSSHMNTSSTPKGRMKKTPAEDKNLKRGHEDKAPPVMMEEDHSGKTQAVKTTNAGSAFQSSYFGSNSAPKRNRPSKKRHVDKCRKDSDRKDMEAVMTCHNEGMSMGDERGSHKGSYETQKVNASGDCKHNGMRDMSQLQIRNMLMDMARKDIRRKLNESSVAPVLRNLDKSRNTNKQAKEKGKERSGNAVKSGAQECQEQELVDSETRAKKSSSSDNLVSQVTDFVSMNVPDPDFHDFDNDRTEKAFGGNQVWAVYDDDDGMPRYYALIHNVISLKPFKMKISLLNSKSNDELAPIKWIGSGFHKTSGDFRKGKHVINGSVNSFSHRVNWKKGLRGVIHIYPKKGDVWALYRNWSPDWNELTPDEIIHKYDMVEVLDDYNEERGVDVAPLVKVSGFKTVFRRHDDPRNIRHIPRAEMFCLSHQVPSYLLTGQEGVNAPRGCLELDPAALPMELLQVVTEAPETAKEMTTGKSSEMGPKHNATENEKVKTFQVTQEKDSVGEAIAEEIKRKGDMAENLIVYKRRRTRENKGIKWQVVCY